jgi:hypothetical protein
MGETVATCRVEGCERPRARTYIGNGRRSVCAAHHHRLTDHGDVLADVPIRAVRKHVTDEDRREMRRAIAARYRERHLEQEKARNVTQLRERRARLRQTVHDLLGNRCATCGSTENLQIDHVNEDGREHRRRLNNNHDKMTREVIASVEAGEGRYQLLCQRHNLDKYWARRRAGAVG